MSYKFEQFSKVMASLLGITYAELLDNFQPATLDDLNAICRLRSAGFKRLGDNDYATMRWRYFHRLNSPSGLFALKLNGEIIAVVGAEPIKVNVGNFTYNGVEAADIVVAKEYLQKGIGAWMNMYLQHQYPIVIAMGANENSSSLVRRVFSPMNCRMHFKYMISLRAYLASKGVPSFMLTVMCLIAWTPLRLRRLVYHTLFTKDYQVRTFTTADEIEIFLNENTSNDTLSRIEKDKAFYHWRYDTNPVSNFIYLAVFHKNNPVALCVLKSGDQSNKKDWYLMDWVLSREYKTSENLRNLYRTCVKYAADNGAESVSILLSDKFSEESAIAAGFSHRSTNDGFYLYANETINKAIFDDSNWYITYADTDEQL